MFVNCSPFQIKLGNTPFSLVELHKPVTALYKIGQRISLLNCSFFQPRSHRCGLCVRCKHCDFERQTQTEIFFAHYYIAVSYTHLTLPTIYSV